MARLLKLLVILVVIAVIIGASAYVLLQNNSNSQGGGGDQGGGGGDNGTTTPDTTPPTITCITQDTVGTPGKTTEIVTTFSDNIAVTSAVLYYRSVNGTDWQSTSLLPTGSADILIPLGDTANYEYYVTADDAAGNGPVGDPSVDGSTYYTITVQQENVTLVHNVFVEEATETTCVNCPLVAQALQELEAQGTYHFIYVALIDDVNSVALDRTKEYNRSGYPEVYVDGGFKVVLGSRATEEETQSTLADAITKADGRDVPPLLLTVVATLDNSTNQTYIQVNVTNYGSTNYVGTLRVYLAERNSYPYFGGNGFYHHGLVRYLTDVPIPLTITARGTEFWNSTLSGNSSAVSNYEIMAAVFNNSAVLQTSTPGDMKNHTFNAYYADACNTTLIVPGANPPPAIGLTFPTAFSINLFNHHILKKIELRTPICIGRPTITAQDLNGSPIVLVKFYIDGKLKANLSKTPYEVKWPLLKPSIGLKKHTVEVVAYDANGQSVTTSITIRVLAL